MHRQTTYALSLAVFVLALSVVPPAATALPQEPVPESNLPQPPAIAPYAGGNPLYPNDMDPPESCGVPAKTPFGEDVEIMIAPWYGSNALLYLNQPPAWQAQEVLPDSYPAASSFDAVALGTEEIVAAWRDTGEAKCRTWKASSGWGAMVSLGTTSTRPTLLSLTSQHWAAFARVGNVIMIREWVNGTLGEWQALPGTDGAASDPVAISRVPGHMAVFYLNADGTAMFTEWEGAWLSHPISLTQAPLIAAAPSALLSDLGAASRNDNHMAVFGVDANNQLWVREWTSWNNADWSDTPWVKLMDGVQIDRPGVASRHANHLGVVVRDISGVPYYIEWAPYNVFIYLPLVTKSYTTLLEVANGQRANSIPSSTGIRPSGSTMTAGYWRAPVALGTEPFASSMTLAATSIDSLSVLGVRSDQALYEKVWTRAAGWAADWQALTAADVKPDQVLPAVVRRPHNLMVLGHYSGTNAAWSKQYTNQDQPVDEVPLDSPIEGIPRAQALAKVDAKTVWLSVNRNNSDGTWNASAWGIADDAAGYLELAQHADSGQGENRVYIATADLDADGDDEAIVATMRSNRMDIDISVLQLSFPEPPTSVVITATTVYQGGLPEGDDINVAAGDLDGDYREDEVVVGYRGLSQMQILAFEYDTGLRYLALRAAMQVPYKYVSNADIDVRGRDMEVAIARVYDRHPSAGQLLGEQLVLLDATYFVGTCWMVEACRIVACWEPYTADCEPYHWRGTVLAYEISPTWTVSLLDEFPNYTPKDYHDNPLPVPPYAAALATGDLNADGYDEIAYSFPAWAATIDVDRSGSSAGQYTAGAAYSDRSLGVGDVDWDGRAEMVLAEPLGGLSGSSAYVVEAVDGGQLIWSASHVVGVPGTGTVLVGDVDNDSPRAKLVGCSNFPEVTVIAVVNGVPRWYEDDGQGGRRPIHDSQGSYAIAKGGGSGSTYGMTTNLGAFTTIGYAQEISLFGFKIGEVRASVTQEFMTTLGQSWSREQSMAQGDGYSFDGPTVGMVIYKSTGYTCYYYDVYAPDTPQNTSRAMVCHPTAGGEYQDLKSLEYWHSEAFKQTVGSSWVEVGHRAPSGALTNDLEEPGNYAAALPVDPAWVRHQWSGAIRVSPDVQGGFLRDWYVEEMQGGAQETNQSFETNTTVSAGATAGGFSVDTGVTFGWGWENSRQVSWEDTLSFGGGVYKFTDTSCLCYDIVPFVYHARARTQNGVLYPYIVLDYYVPWIGSCLRGDGSK